MMKRVLSLLVVVTVLVSFGSAFAVLDSYGNFSAKNNYSNQFADVRGNEWFFEAVKQGYEYGLIKGSSLTQYSPDKSLSIAECITLAVRLHSIYTTGAEPSDVVPVNGNWYDPYVDYALKNGVISKTSADYKKAALRSEVAEIFAKALPGGDFKQINTVDSGAIPDVQMGAPYADAVYKLYRAGILTGSDGLFKPNSTIKRSEIAAICTRIADPSQRVSFTLSKMVLTSQQIAEKCAPAVFFVKTYLLNGAANGTGSGFFITSNGYAITNFHVVANCSEIEIKTEDGKIYNDVIIVDSDKDNDLALLKVNGTGFKYLEMGDNSDLKQGQDVYAFGSPLGLENTMSKGIVSSVRRIIDGVTYIQISVPIAPGSSGGALVDDTGKVVGITTAGYQISGDLNLAVPINTAKLLNRNATNPLFVWDEVYYPNFSEVFDFGYFTGVDLLDSIYHSTGFILEYDILDFYDSPKAGAADNFIQALLQYNNALKLNGFIAHEVIDVLSGTYYTENEFVKIELDFEKGTITITAARIPQYYPERATLADFGWYTNMSLDDEALYVGGSILYSYKWADYYSYDDLMDLLISYIGFLTNDGFTLVGIDSDGILLESDSLSLVIMMAEKYIHLDVYPGW